MLASPYVAQHTHLKRFQLSKNSQKLLFVFAMIHINSLLPSSHRCAGSHGACRSKSDVSSPPADFASRADVKSVYTVYVQPSIRESDVYGTLWRRQRVVMNEAQFAGTATDRPPCQQHGTVLQWVPV